jgi:uncharacterized membrane protein YphA (DoxX/SURF4 family)
VVRLTALLQGQALEHGSTRSGRWLRRYRLRIALWIAVVEGALIVLDVIPWWPALLVAAVLLAFWWFVGRNTRSDTVREGSRIAAASQALMALVPIFVAVVGFLAILVLALLGIAALLLLFSDRR